MQGDYYLSIYFTWEMPRAAIIHLPRHNRGARMGGTHKKVSFIFSFSPNPKDNIPELRRVVQAPILKYHMQRKESTICGKRDEVAVSPKKKFRTHTFPARGQR